MSEPVPESSGAPIGRRVFLGLLGFGAAGIVVGAKVQDFMGKVLAPIEAKDFTGLTSLLPFSQFRYYSITGSFPHRARNKYTLQVAGLVDNPFTISYDELTAMPVTKIERDFQCVTGWRVPDQHWTGVKLSHLLDRAGVKPEATALRFVSFDGEYTESLTLDQARRPTCWSHTSSRASRCRATTAGRPGSMSRRCTATSRASGSRASSSPRTSSPATGSRTATTSTVGSATATAATTHRHDRSPHDGHDMSIRVKAPDPALPRFNRVERYTHWCTATLMIVLLFTGFAMYVGPLSTLVGRRLLMRTIHVYAGLLLPIPVLVAIALHGGKQLRTDLGRLNRWTA